MNNGSVWPVRIAIAAMLAIMMVLKEKAIHFQRLLIHGRTRTVINAAAKNSAIQIRWKSNISGWLRDRLERSRNR